jgi:predicted ester cyclase
VVNTPESNKAVVRRHLEVTISQNRPAIWDEIMRDDFTIHNPAVTPGRAGYRAAVEMLRAGFPDLREEILDMVAENDRVSVRYVERGTHTGDFAGHAPTGRTYEKWGLAIYRVQDGRLAEEWNLEDLPAFQRQIFG